MSWLAILVSTLITAVGIGLVGVPAPTIDAARQATPAAASPATRDNGEMLDLPAMVLQPADLVAVGLGEGFGIFGGDLFDLAEAAETSARNRGDSSASRVAEITATLKDAGFRQGYSLDMGTPADTPVGVGVQVTSEIVEYADAAGAAAGFAYVTDTTEVIDLEVEEVAGARRFGDESLTLQWSGGESSTGTAFQAFSSHARVGRLVLYIAIYGPADQPPELDVAEALMERLLERVAHEARPARGELAYLVARLGGEEVERDYDFYGRLDGVTLPYFGDTAETLASRELSASRDTYVLGQWVQAGGGGAEDDLRYEIGLYRLASPKLAAAWLDGYLFGLTDFPVVANMPPLGDWAITYRDEKDRGNGIQATGFATYLRTGNDVLILIVNAVPGIDQAGYEELVLRNVDCLRSGFCLDPVPVPQDLISRGEIATPAAGSSGARATPTD